MLTTLADTENFEDFSAVAVDRSGIVYVGYTNWVPGVDTISLSGMRASPPIYDNIPTAVVVDDHFNLFELNGGYVTEITEERNESILAGYYWSGSADGTGTDAQFYSAKGEAVDHSGNVYVADTGNHTIRKITADGVVTTLAGLAGISGSADGTGSAARFNGPCGVAVDRSGTVYVADTGNHTIRKITADGVVSTVAGLASNAGFVDGTGSVVRFNAPLGVAVDSVGAIYVADTGNNAIRLGTPVYAYAPLFTTQPAGQAISGGGSESFSAVAYGDPAPGYQWQVSSNGGSTWNNLSNTGPYSGSTSVTLTITGATPAMNGYQYRCLASNAVQSNVASDAAALTVNRISSSVPANFTGNGQSDLVWQNLKTGERDIQLMNGTTMGNEVLLGAISTAWRIAGTGDFNGDGQTDILWENSTTGEYGIYLMNGTAVSSWVSLGSVPTVWQIAGVGDFNGDGQPDILWQNTSTGERGIYLMNGTAVTSWVALGTVPVAWNIVGVGDFDGDGKPDILWQNTPTGECGIYLMNGTTVSSWVSLGKLPIIQQISGVGDFNSTGQPDILWQNAVTGERGIYLMNGTTVTGSVSLGIVSKDLSLGTNGFTPLTTINPDDFNGDGQSDIVWQNTSTGERGFYLMNGTTVSSWVSLGTVSTAWKIAGTGDFNGDGQSDILWQNATTGEYGLYLMNGTAVTGWVSLGSVPTAWRAAGTGDFNGDGQADILWQNTSTGEYGIYLMNGTSVTSWVSLGSVPTAWRILGTGDFNGDGQADILWQNTSTGEYGIYLMNGTSVTSWVALGSVPTAWQIAGTGDFNGDGQTDILWQNTSTGGRGIYLMNGTSVTSWVALGNVSTDWSMKN
jgi:hypothetical protein